MSAPGHIECCVSNKWNKLGQRSLRRYPQYFSCIAPLNGTAICCSKQWKDKGSLGSSQMWQLRSEKNACASIPITLEVLMATGTKVGCGNQLSIYDLLFVLLVCHTLCHSFMASQLSWPVSSHLIIISRLWFQICQNLGWIQRCLDVIDHRHMARVAAWALLAVWTMSSSSSSWV